MGYCRKAYWILWVDYYESNGKMAKNLMGSRKKILWDNTAVNLKGCPSYCVGHRAYGSDESTQRNKEIRA